jgi:hypothetical protein
MADWDQLPEPLRVAVKVIAERPNISRSLDEELEKALDEISDWAYDHLMCEAVVSHGDRVDPPEYCDSIAEPDATFCAQHATLEELLQD